jgi:hypothetical protein
MDEKRLFCTQCGNTFIFTVAQQQRFDSLGFNAPKRCEECRKKKIKDGPSRHEVKMKYKRQKSRDLSEDVFDH